MAKTSSVEKNNRRRKLAAQYAAKRKALKAIIMDQSKPIEERFRAQLKLAAMPRNRRQDPHPQPLRSHRPSARLLPQARRCRASRFVNSAIPGRSPASSSRAGKEDITCH